ncbi:winged helix-turn-helix domain-containing protein [Amycolatopsis sp.]|uniref:winged helix-turn-helix domain-containing protein n=1 Tax=Amycolatopsis sp. TaxID=37632 RepID=UPI002C5B2CB3|nr:winged helix-turn-helix domain-containing protein [Amycolatopsis sp.]HVV11992.1 winged helix-turn-helix domain-containing protein [Amycolatopsis sp.]
MVPDADPDAQIARHAPQVESVQLAAILAARIKRGDWKPGWPITSEERLAQEYGLVRNTVRKAIKLLVNEGYVFVAPRRGTYVAEHDDT